MSVGAQSLAGIKSALTTTAITTSQSKQLQLVLAPSVLRSWVRPDDGDVSANDFYQDVAANQLFRQFLSTVIGRINSLTGVAYK